MRICICICVYRRDDISLLLCVALLSDRFLEQFFQNEDPKMRKKCRGFLKFLRRQKRL